MNNRIRKKRYRKDILSNVQSINPISGDFIVVKYPMHKMSCHEVFNIAEFVQSNFKKNKVIFIPDSLSIEAMDAKNFTAMVDNLSKYRKQKVD